MYFRSQKKLQGEVSLSETIESYREGNALQLMDVIGVDDTMLEDLYDRDSAHRLRRLVKECLTQRESEVIRLRYGLGGTVPLTQREIASTFGIFRSYVSRRHQCKRSPGSLALHGFVQSFDIGGSTAVIVNDKKAEDLSGHSSIILIALLVKN